MRRQMSVNEVVVEFDWVREMRRNGVWVAKVSMSLAGGQKRAEQSG